MGARAEVRLRPPTLGIVRVLVTGGSGYIGAHTSLLLAERGDEVVIVDDLVGGHPSRVDGIPVVRLDLASDAAVDTLAATMRDYSIEAVVHFAARKQVAESVERPAWYYRENVGGAAQLLIAMEQAGVGQLVFSSSAAVYGEADGAIDESHPTRPVNPYGATKLAGEQLAAASATAWGLRAASLRYFNVGGAASAALGDVEAQNLIPLVFDRIEAGLPPQIFGEDYATADGTCVRDYVHVSDVAEAHLAMLDSLPSEPGNSVFNVGTGTGTSVRQMVDAIAAVTGTSPDAVVRPRRAGDPAAVVAVVDRMRSATGWSARLGLDDIIRSAWDARVSRRQQA